jgi:hypothetical protein
MNTIFLAEAIVIFVLLFAFGLVFSHRIAGPLYKFRMHLESSAKSKRYSKVMFRSKDFFVELADAYNRQIPESKSNKSGKDR